MGLMANSGLDQKDEQLTPETRLSSSDSPSAFSGLRYNKFSFSALFSTSFSVPQGLNVASTGTDRMMKRLINSWKSATRQADHR
jgi:hypothetical protein